MLRNSRGSFFVRKLNNALPPLSVETPWWNHAEPLVQAAAARHGLGITVLRLIVAERPHPPGGVVSYLAELDSGAPTGLRPGSFAGCDIWSLTPSPGGRAGATGCGSRRRGASASTTDGGSDPDGKDWMPRCCPR